MSEPTRQYPVPCAKCAEVKAYPFQVRTLTDKPGHIEVNLRCRECGHEWRQVLSNTD